MAPDVQDFTTTLRVAQTPREVFDAVTDVRGWWSQGVIGATSEQGGEFVDEWAGTRIIFDVSQEQDGTRMPAWTQYVQHSLMRLLTTGEGDPNLERGTIEKPTSAAG
jgi:hypothetical protein